jgi:methylenetetrahydrofolate dehydrogenase (NADP+)/methenyltetrahydrofolate cyclohydrolase
MGAHIIDGNKLASEIYAELASAVRNLRTRGIIPTLAVIVVGKDPASLIYVRNKTARAEKIGIGSVHLGLPEETTTADLLAVVERMNTEPTVDGILVQMPLPAHINSDAVVAAINPHKDVDGFHPLNVGRLAAKQKCHVPCTPQGCMRLIRTVQSNLAGLHAAVIGRSRIVGQPIGQLLLQADCSVTFVHSKTPDPATKVRLADIVIAAAGAPGLVKREWIKPGAIVIDVGINRVADGTVKGRIVGDVDFERASTVAGAITPVPGGFGPMTIACLLANTVAASQSRLLA